MKPNNSLTSTEHWETYWQNNNASPTLGENNILEKWIKENIPETNGGSCLELGCYPGRYLTVFGDLGYTLYGLDLIEDTLNVPKCLTKMGYKVGTFWIEDIYKFKEICTDKFDIVSSFGLIEHFTDFKNIVKIHCDFITERGYLVIEVPNFRGIPHFLIRKLFDAKIYKTHYLPAMRIRTWESLLINEGFEIIYIGGIGSYSYHLDTSELNTFQNFLYVYMKKIESRIKKFFPSNSRNFSPYLGVIARKIDHKN